MVSGTANEAKYQEKTSEQGSVDVMDVDSNEEDDGLTGLFYPLSTTSGVYSAEKGICLITFAIDSTSGSTRDEIKVRVASGGNQLEVEYPWLKVFTDARLLHNLWLEAEE